MLSLDLHLFKEGLWLWVLVSTLAVPLDVTPPVFGLFAFFCFSLSVVASARNRSLKLKKKRKTVNGCRFTSLRYTSISFCKLYWCGRSRFPRYQNIDAPSPPLFAKFQHGTFASKLRAQRKRLHCRLWKHCISDSWRAIELRGRVHKSSANYWILLRFCRLLLC